MRISLFLLRRHPRPFGRAVCILTCINIFASWMPLLDAIMRPCVVSNLSGFHGLHVTEIWTYELVWAEDDAIRPGTERKKSK